jgi:pimeloyl-ACP methyl ester carboxylesterase
MTDRLLTNPADYVVPLDINKLEGRMMYLPAPTGKSRDILLVPGHHGMIERWWSLAENLNDYGSVTMPDLPGFGGMDSFYKIRKKPDIDAYADYLAAFIKLRFRRKRITIVGVSFGFVIVTRMLQRYPELSKKIDLLISIVGFMHEEDFIYPAWQRKSMAYASRILSTRPMCLIQKVFFINRPVIALFYDLVPYTKELQNKMSKEEHLATVDFEANLWMVNDLRSHWRSTYEFLRVDNCQVPVDLAVVHVIPRVDHYFDHDLIKQHMLVVFRSYKGYISNNKNHPPSIISDKKGVGILLPPGVRRMLNS